MQPVTHQAYPLHCLSPLVTTSGLTILTLEACNPIVIEQDDRVYMVIYRWCAAFEVDLFTGLQRLPFDFMDIGHVKTPKET
jgi:hypothetical protein